MDNPMGLRGILQHLLGKQSRNSADFGLTPLQLATRLWGHCLELVEGGFSGL